MRWYNIKQYKNENYRCTHTIIMLIFSWKRRFVSHAFSRTHTHTHASHGMPQHTWWRGHKTLAIMVVMTIDESSNRRRMSLLFSIPSQLLEYGTLIRKRFVHNNVRVRKRRHEWPIGFHFKGKHRRSGVINSFDFNIFFLSVFPRSRARLCVRAVVHGIFNVQQPVRYYTIELTWKIHLFPFVRQ